MPEKTTALQTLKRQDSVKKVIFEKLNKKFSQI
jgi:hypothetical protein